MMRNLQIAQGVEKMFPCKHEVLPALHSHNACKRLGALIQAYSTGETDAGGYQTSLASYSIQINKLLVH